MSQNLLLSPVEVRQMYEQIVPAYQAAFARPPWNEMSACPDPEQQCDGGLSSMPIGELCVRCALRPTVPAYPAEVLQERFNALAASRPTLWYVERLDDEQVALAAVGWVADPVVIAAEKYQDVPEMAMWLAERLPGTVLWLDEVFANRDVRANGNLANFGTFVRGMAAELDASVVAYRTIEPRMIAVAQRDFDEQAIVLARDEGVPDRRDFVIINLAKEPT